nr:hypothetical protein [Cerasicoccus arenae]
MGAWRGVGPSAASQWQRWRWANPSDLNAWLDGLDGWRAGELPSAAQEIVPLTPELLAADALIFGLRLNTGVQLGALQARFPNVNWELYATLWEQLIDEGALTRNGDCIQLTGEGRLLADAVAGRILEAEV